MVSRPSLLRALVVAWLRRPTVARLSAGTDLFPSLLGVRDLMQNAEALRTKGVTVRPVTMQDFWLALTVIEPVSRTSKRCRKNRVASWSPRKRHFMEEADEIGVDLRDA
jgi:hypothetical protein